MTELHTDSGLAPINNARIYYEVAGRGKPFVMVHAGVADSRQWNNEFWHFASHFRVIRYDMRGFGRSELVAGEFNHLEDLVALLDYLHVTEPAIVMGCSMGGGLAMDFALSRPSAVSAVIMVGAGPSGLELDVPAPAKFEEAEEAYKTGDLDRVAEIETQIWFDGMGREPADVNQPMRKLVYDMNRKRLSYADKQSGKRLPNTDTPAAGRLSELLVPVLVIVGVHDVPFLMAAADYMLDKIPNAKKLMISDAAHLPNMDHPAEFQQAVTDFLEQISA